jgi:hypothetical protein
MKKSDIITALALVICSLAVYLYLFGYADRKVVFLYEHLGFKPFDKITRGRYWMTGFVLSGFLSTLYLLIKLIWSSGNIVWKNVLRLSIIPLIIGIVLITSLVGQPVLPFGLAVSSAITLPIGLGLGLSVVDDLVANPRSTFLYLLFSLGIIPLLVLFRMVELPAKGILSWDAFWMYMPLLFIGALAWLFIGYRIFKSQKPSWIDVLKGALALGYVDLPLLHYLSATPEGIPYVTSADNFFPDHLLLRFLNWIVVLGILFFVDWCTKRILLKRSA